MHRRAGSSTVSFHFLFKMFTFSAGFKGFFLSLSNSPSKVHFFFFLNYFPNPGSPLCLRLKHSTCHNLCLSTDTIKLFYCCSALLQKEGPSCLPSVPRVFLFNICSQCLKELSAKRVLQPSVSLSLAHKSVSVVNLKSGENWGSLCSVWAISYIYQDPVPQS